MGRQREVEALEGWFQRAATGDRQLVFVSGEVGIGKTTVLDLWLARCATAREVWMARGQCVEHVGEGEPYLPLLDALGQLGRGPAGGEILAVLRRYAPMWLMQLPGLVSETESWSALQRQVQGATPARMLRECAEALDVLTADRPLVLVLEDLHWSDSSTVECLAPWHSGGSRRGCWCWGRIARWTRCCGRIPCAAWCRSCVGEGWAWNSAWSSSLPRMWRRMWLGGWAGQSPPPWPRLSTRARTAMRCSW